MPRIAGLRFWLPAMALALLAGYVSAQSAGPPATTSLTGIDWSKAEHMTVIMTEYEFNPDRLTFRHGIPTRLRLVNNSASIHDFTAPDFFKTVDFRDPGVIGPSGIGIAVEPHRQKEVDLIARLPGQFGLICADHDWTGMTANISVQ
jgi:plastocyanin